MIFEKGVITLEEIIDASDKQGYRRLKLIFVVTISYMFCEMIGSYLTKSVALFADATHMLMDSSGLAIAFCSFFFARKLKPNALKTYGYLRIEVLGALLSILMLCFLVEFIIRKAVDRIYNPAAIDSGPMLILALIGLAINIWAIFLLRKETHFNARAAFLHVAADFFGSVGAVIAGIIMYFTKWYLIDAIIGFAVATVVIFGMWHIVHDIVDVLLEACPDHIDSLKVKKTILEIPGVKSIHDLHIWTLTSGYIPLSAHIVIDEKKNPEKIITQIKEILKKDFGINHVTIQTSCPHLCKEAEFLAGK